MAIIVRSRDSLLTTTSGFSNYRGILNLVIILLVLSNARAALENFIKYGLLVDPYSWIHFFRGGGSQHWPALLIVFGLTFHILLAIIIEKLIAKLCLAQAQVDSPTSPTKTATTTTTTTSTINNNTNSNSNKTKGSPKKIAHKGGSSIKLACSTLLLVADTTLVINLFACIAIPPLVIYTHDTHPISNSGSLMLVSIVFLKLVSYHMMNYWCRDARKPEHLQARTTKCFLRTYMPPVVDFASTCELAKSTPPSPPPPPPSSPSSSPASTSKQEAAASPPSTGGNKTTKLATSPSVNGSLRQRLPVGSNNTQTNSDNTGDRKLNGNKEGHSPSNRSSSRERKLSLTRKAAMEVVAKYPSNISIQDMCSFMVFPTLCYELDYARTERIRKRFLIKRIVELIILSQLDMALIQQWIVPTVSNSVLPFRQMQFSHMLERLLKLAIPNHVIWLIWFYLFFHSLLNIAAELTRFADREFYRDWWNSESVNYFWSNWNIPVHKWCVRHLYQPLLSLGLTRCQASTAVFFVSAFFHEYLVSVPLKLFRMWAFTGMLIQLPWARFVSLYVNNNFANVAVWVSLIIGQPLCILMYYHDYYVINYVKSLPT